MRITIYLVIEADGTAQLRKRRPNSIPYGGCVVPLVITIPAPAGLPPLHIALPDQPPAVQAGEPLTNQEPPHEDD